MRKEVIILNNKKKGMPLWRKISEGNALLAEDVLMCIDDEEVKDMFKDDGELHAFVLSSDTDKECRMEHLVEQMNEHSKERNLNHAYVCFFVPETRPLLMSELQTFCEWAESLSGDVTIMRDSIAVPSSTIQAVVLMP